MDQTLARPPVGRVLDGRYRVESLIATGGMATVYLGTDTRLDRTVALKVMHAELANDEDFVRRFVGEARSVARLSHPNVVAVYDQGADGRTLYLAMEYVPGRTLRDLMNERGRLRPRDALDIMDGVLAGLGAAHAAGIAHRDVKPENVLLTSGHSVKVADFGLARMMAGTSHTKTGLLIGTAAYLAPEQVSRGTADARTDVYAAGIMLFEMLTGTQPHTADTPLAVAYKHVNEVVPAPSRFGTGDHALAGRAGHPGHQPGPGPAAGGRRAVPPRGPARCAAACRPPPGHRRPRPRYPTRVPGPPIQAPDTMPGGPAPAAAARPVTRRGYRRRDPAARAGPGGLCPGLHYPPAEPAPRRPARRAAGEAALIGRSARIRPPRPGPPGLRTSRRAAAAWPPRRSTTTASTGRPTTPWWWRPGRRRTTGAAAMAAHGGHEPGLQRWLFSRRLIYLLAGLAAVVLIGVLVWYQAAGKYTTVPRVARLTAATAQQALHNAGLTATMGTAQFSDSVAKGSVIGTSPAIGSRVGKGSTVTLIVSKGAHRPPCRR